MEWGVVRALRFEGQASLRRPVHLFIWANILGVDLICSRFLCLLHFLFSFVTTQPRERSAEHILLELMIALHPLSRVIAGLVGAFLDMDIFWVYKKKKTEALDMAALALLASVLLFLCLFVLDKRAWIFIEWVFGSLSRQADVGRW